MDKIKFIEVDDSYLSIRWHHALLLLSLDRVDRYWSEFGLEIQNRDRVRGLIRECVKAEQALMELSDEQYHSSMESDMINNLLGSIIENEGDLTAKNIRDWVEKKFIVSSRDRWKSDWCLLFFRLDRDIELPVVAGIDMEKLAALRKLSKKMDDINDEVEPEIEALEKEPKSEWDLNQYAIYQKENPDCSPLDILGNYLYYWRFINNWDQILALLTPDELSALEHYFKAVARATNRDPESLTIPAQYRHPEL